MDKKHIQKLIIRFFENDFSKEIVLKFQQWFVHTEDCDTRDDVLNGLWEQETTEADERTLLAMKDMAIRINGEEKPVRRTFFPQSWLRIAGILLLLILNSVFVYHYLYDKNVAAPEMTQYVVPDGEMKQIDLPDGSRVWLNAGSVLLFAGDLSGATRSLFLDGEARFHVAKDSLHPFIVKTQYMEVEAIGTTFDVKSYRNSEDTEVTLEEGIIRVDLNARVVASELMQPNEQFIYNHREAKTIKKQVDAALVSRWREGYLVFEGASFEEVIRTIERRFNVTINYDIRKYGGGSFSIKYAPYENVNQVLSILKTLNPGMTWSVKKNTIDIK